MTLEIIVSMLGEIIGVHEDDLSGGTPLTPEYDVETIDVAKLVIEIEKRFEVTVHDEDVHKFHTVKDIAEYVDALIDE